MDTEQRIEALEQEVKIFKNEIQETLADIQQNLPEPAAPPVRWQKKAWSLAILNMLLAVALFTNVYFYIPGNAPFDMNATLAAWLRAFWIVMAFMWLLLQMYPLALLLEQEDGQWQGVARRNVMAFLRAHPSFIVVVTLAVLIVSVINLVLPVTWLIIAAIVLVGVASIALWHMVELHRAQAHTHSKP
jgi:hypothetical protein